MAGTGNASKKQKDHSPGPWMDWTETNKAERAIRFIETYCRPPKGYGYGEPMKLSDDQKEWFRDILAPGVTLAMKSCPRGEGKSTEFAALAIWATFDRSDTGQPQVPIVATTVGQAVRSVYGVATEMIKQEPELDNRCTMYTAMGQQRIEVLETGGTCFPIANDVDGLQGLDPSLAVMDEIGFQSIDSWQSVVLASGKRNSSLVVGIGTPGLDRENALWITRQLIKDNGCPEGFVYREHAAPEGCDHTLEENWYKASSALRAGYRSVNSYRTALGITPEAKFRIFYLGQWAEGADSWLGPRAKDIWQSLKNPYCLVPGEKTIISLDVGIKRDSTALMIFQKRKDNGKIHVVARISQPTKDTAIDITDIMQDIRDLSMKYNVTHIAYDPRLFEVPSKMLRDEGYPMIEFPQSIERMSPAVGDLYEAIMRQEITHDGDNEQFQSHILNAVPRHNERGFMLSKDKSHGKIDAAVALAIGWGTLMAPGKIMPPLACY